MRDQLGIDRPYLLLDVETRSALRAEECLNMRATLAEVAKARWEADTKGGPAELQPLPPTPDGGDCRVALLAAQMSHPLTKGVILQKRVEQGGTRGERKVLKGKVIVKPLDLSTYRLDPLDDVLEKKVILAEGVMWVPVIPDLHMPMGGKTWRNGCLN